MNQQRVYQKEYWSNEAHKCFIGFAKIMEIDENKLSIYAFGKMNKLTLQSFWGRNGFDSKRIDA
jgi:hypothetical protein